MFSTPIPGIADFVRIYGDAIVGRKDSYADTREGSVYDYPGGVSAVLWSRESQRDEDMFAVDYLDTATGDDLTDLVLRRYGIQRYLDTPGVGVVTFQRTSTAAGGGDIWEGTRIAVVDVSGRSEPTYYEVADDTSVASTATTVSAPVRATFNGLGAKISATINDVKRPRLDDVLWDSSWVAVRLDCQDGTELEPPDKLRARVRQTRLDNRSGFPRAIIRACNRAGAARVALFRSDYGDGTSDAGLNVCYVGDVGYNATSALVKACMVAVDSARVCGDGLQVLPMLSQALTVKATVYLTDAPSEFNLQALGSRLQRALSSYAGLGFAYGIDELRGVMIAASSAVQDAAITTPSSDATVLQTIGGVLNFPAVLPRYTIRQEDVHLTFVGPQ